MFGAGSSPFLVTVGAGYVLALADLVAFPNLRRSAVNAATATIAAGAAFATVSDDGVLGLAWVAPFAGIAAALMPLELMRLRGRIPGARRSFRRSSFRSGDDGATSPRGVIVDTTLSRCRINKKGHLAVALRPTSLDSSLTSRGFPSSR
jgi:hypothetical protein